MGFRRGGIRVIMNKGGEGGNGNNSLGKGRVAGDKVKRGMWRRD